MIKRLVLSFFVAMCALTLGTSVRDARAAGKNDVCHAPPGNPGAAFTISVGSSAALAAHLAHGDTRGACSTEPPPPTCEERCEAGLDTCLIGAAGDPDVTVACEQEWAIGGSACIWLCAQF